MRDIHNKMRGVRQGHCTHAILLLISSALLASQSYAGEKPGFPFPDHIDQHKIKEYPIETVYGWGKQLFGAPFNRLDGVGRNFKEDPPDAIRMPFSRIPRPDLPGFVSDPIRMSGPGARNCRECHNAHSGNILNSMFNFSRDGNISMYAERQTPNIAGVGALQLLAEQSSKELWAIRDNALAQALSTSESVTVELKSSNDVSYGFITANPDGSLDTSGVQGVGATDNLFLLSKQFQVVPFYSKGEVGFVRVTGATAPTGMPGPEMYPEFYDNDHDGVVGEISAGDVTSLTVYAASQPRPVTKLELHKNLGGKFRLPRKTKRAIKNGEQVFDAVGCTGCHKPEAEIYDATFSEPSATPGFSFPFFWAKYMNANGTPGFTSPLPYGYDISDPLTFSLADLASIPCDVEKSGHASHRHGQRQSVKTYNRAHKSCWREYESTDDGGIIIRPYTDLKRYDMGPGLADKAPASFGGVTSAIWKTKALWGVGSTGPWLHDGRATTLTEAIKWHGGDAQSVTDQFFSLSEQEQDDLVAFLKNLVIFNDYYRAVQESGNGFFGDG